MKRYSIQDPKNNEDVLGGPVGEENVYITTYGGPVEKGGKEPAELEVGESVLRRYSLSGSTGVYRVVRLEDGATPEEPTGSAERPR